MATELPPAVRAAVEALTDDVLPADLATAATALSDRYRRGGRTDAGGHGPVVPAYLTARLPATYAATARAMAALAAADPGFEPGSVLDLGAGPATATLAAVAAWPTVRRARLVEPDPAMAAAGAALLDAGAADVQADWQPDDLPAASTRGRYDLVVLAYVAEELAPDARTAALASAWAATAGALLLVGAGTPDGWARMLAARDQLVAGGATLAAPCPHHEPCPLSGGDWCHFSERLPRSRRHRRAKGGSAPYEDERFTFVAATRHALAAAAPVVLAPPRVHRHGVEIRTCDPDGRVADLLVRRRDGDAYRRARAARWGDRWGPR